MAGIEIGFWLENCIGNFSTNRGAAEMVMEEQVQNNW
jgi:hypothetical protein